jgi:hypothetical protein
MIGYTSFEVDSVRYNDLNSVGAPTKLYVAASMMDDYCLLMHHLQNRVD